MTDGFDETAARLAKLPLTPRECERLRDAITECLAKNDRAREKAAQRAKAYRERRRQARLIEPDSGS